MMTSTGCPNNPFHNLFLTTLPSPAFPSPPQLHPTYYPTSFLHSATLDPKSLTLMISSLPNHLPKTPSLNTIALRVKISMYTFWKGTNIRSITR